MNPLEQLNISGMKPAVLFPFLSIKHPTHSRVRVGYQTPESNPNNYPTNPELIASIPRLLGTFCPFSSTPEVINNILLEKEASPGLFSMRQPPPDPEANWNTSPGLSHGKVETLG